jgi:hypothetical protein
MGEAMDIWILLLGGNPLPNFVAAGYLLKLDREDTDIMPVPDTIVLVYSSRTEDFYYTITESERLTPRPRRFIRVDLEDRHREPLAIRQKLMSRLHELDQPGTDPITSIHLNYTGGTKPMALNSFIAVSAFMEQRRARFVVSDLDPDLFSIVPIDMDVGEDQLVGFPLKGDLRDYVKLDIGSLLKLHDMDVREAGTTDLIYGEDRVSVDRFVQEAVAVYRDFRPGRHNRAGETLIFTEFSKRFSLKGRKPEEQEKNLIKQGIFEAQFPEIKETFPSLHGLFDEDGHLIPPAYKFVDLFRGGWLEDYVLKHLLALKSREEIDADEIRKRVRASYGDRETEIDITVMKGYQLFLVSCTTSREIGYVKQKAFEALYRAEQLGGEHARVIVVSTMYNKEMRGNTFSRQHNLDQLKKDLEQFEVRHNCRLLGFDQLALPGNDPNHLSGRLRHIIQGGKDD